MFEENRSPTSYKSLYSIYGRNMMTLKVTLHLDIQVFENRLPKNAL